jgi:nucleotidyltransferase substrate binding protein (TIGR01987 family)
MDASDRFVVLGQFEVALARFTEVLREDVSANAAFLDASVKRFEFCFELCWKTLRRFLDAEGIPVGSPREAFRQAFKLGWLPEGDDLWSRMIDDRNRTSHTYNVVTANEVYSALPGYVEAYRALVTRLRAR